MKTLSIKTLSIATGLVCLTALYTVPVLAGIDDFNYPPQAKFESLKTRDQVRMEYFQALRDTSLAKDDVNFYAQTSFTGSKTLAEAQREYALSKQLPSSNDWDPPQAMASTLTREAVVAETIEFMRANNGSNVQMGSK